MSCLITPMEAEENGCRLSPSAYVSEEYALEIGVTDLDLEVLMCENSKLQAELEEIQDEFVETMGEFIRLKQEWEGCKWRKNQTKSELSTINFTWGTEQN